MVLEWLREPSLETLPRPPARSVLQALAFLLIGVLAYVAVVLTLQVRALNRQVDSYRNIEDFLVGWLADFQKERQAGTLAVAAEARDLRRTGLLFLRFVYLGSRATSSFSDPEFKALLEGIDQQDDRSTGTG